MIMSDATRAIMEWVTFGIAVFGAVLSLVNFITDLVRHRPHLKVYFRRGFVGYPGALCETRSIEVVNVGEVAVVVTQFGARVNWKKDFVPIASIFEDGSQGHRKLEPGETCSVFLSSRDCAAREMAHPIRAFVRIATHKEFVSARIKENLNLVADKLNV